MNDLTQQIFRMMKEIEGRVGVKYRGDLHTYITVLSALDPELVEPVEKEVLNHQKMKGKKHG